YTSAEALRIATALLSPVLPQSAPKIWTQLGIAGSLDDLRFDTLKWGGLQPGQTIGEVSPVFPRIEAKETIAKMRALEEEVTAQQAALLGKTIEAAAPASEKISIDDFLKVDLRVGKVLTAQPVKNSTKLI